MSGRFGLFSMGRRALRKIDPSLELSGHLVLLGELPRPWDGEAVFGRRAALEVEIGSGKGLFLRTAAASRPAVDFLGVEIGAKYARFAAAGLAKRALPNARVVQGDAIPLFEEVLPADSLAAVHVYFPDPWWKRRHRRRRVMRESLVRHIQRTLVPGGTLHFWTDVQEYFEATLALLAEATTLEGPLDVPERAAQHDMDYHTHFERRTRLEGEMVHRAEFRKSLASSVERGLT